MGNRYYITGAQLGILIGSDNEDMRKNLGDDIIDKQFLCNGAGFKKLKRIFGICVNPALQKEVQES